MGGVHHRVSARSVATARTPPIGECISENDHRLRDPQNRRLRKKQTARKGEGLVTFFMATIFVSLVFLMGAATVSWKFWGPLTRQRITDFGSKVKQRLRPSSQNKYHSSQKQDIAGSFGHELQNRLGLIGGQKKLLQQQHRDSVESRMEELRRLRAQQEKVVPIQRYSTMAGQETRYSTETSVIPFVIMAYNRVEYLKQVMESIRASDFPRTRGVPIIISQDGHVPEMVNYVESIKGDFRIIHLFHPYSCYEHPDSFPGNDPKLNEGFAGDSYGNPRSEWATCCKHHFTWMMNQVFALETFQHVDTFFFLEEDYIVAKTIYSSICMGLNVMTDTEQQTTNGYFGLAMNSTTAAKNADRLPPPGEFFWTVKTFRTGPMTLNRQAFALIRNHSKEYCTKYDEYNWDWTLVSMQRDQLLPSTMLVPFRIPLVQHIGASGMHSEHASEMDLINRHFATTSQRKGRVDFDAFLSLEWIPTNGTRGKLNLPPPHYHKESGGWSHPADRQHCLKLFGGSSSKANSNTT